VTEAALPQPSNRRLIAWLAFVLTLAALAYLGRFYGEEPAQDVFYTWSFAVNGLVMEVILVVIVLLIAIGLPKREFFALRRPTSWRRALGGAGAVFGGVLVLSFVVGLFLRPTEEQGLVPDQWDSARLAPFAVNLVVVATVVPITEELVFRGAGVTLLSRFGTREAIVTVGVLFGLVHGLVEAMPILSAFGMGLAWLRIRTNSIVPCILLHGFFNLFAVVVGVAAGARL
jgi:membrane protease YdiL (CAAX protease family)